MQDFISSLPPEIILLIFQYLNGKELELCCRVSKKWRDIANVDNLWKELCHLELRTRGKYVEVPDFDYPGTLKPVCFYRHVYSSVASTINKWEGIKPEVAVEISRSTETIYSDTFMFGCDGGWINVYKMDDEKQHLQTIQPVLPCANCWNYEWIEGCKSQLLILSAYKPSQLFYLCYTKVDNMFKCCSIIYRYNTRMRYVRPEDFIMNSRMGYVKYNPLSYPSGLIGNILVVGSVVNNKVYLHFCSLLGMETLNVIELEHSWIRRGWRAIKDCLYVLDTQNLTCYNTHGEEEFRLETELPLELRQQYNSNFNSPMHLTHKIDVNEQVILAGFIVRMESRRSIYGYGLIIIWSKETRNILLTFNCGLTDIMLHPALPVYVYVDAFKKILLCDIRDMSCCELPLTHFNRHSKFLNLRKFVAGKFLIVNRRYHDFLTGETVFHAMFDLENLIVNQHVVKTEFKSVRKISKSVVEGYHMDTVNFTTYIVYYII